MIKIPISCNTLQPLKFFVNLQIDDVAGQIWDSGVNSGTTIVIGILWQSSICAQIFLLRQNVDKLVSQCIWTMVSNPCRSYSNMCLRPHMLYWKQKTFLNGTRIRKLLRVNNCSHRLITTKCFKNDHPSKKREADYFWHLFSEGALSDVSKACSTYNRFTIETYATKYINTGLKSYSV